MLANRFRSAYKVSTNVSIDEMMIRFTRRSKHRLTMKNKPIDKGSKIFAICNHGYKYGFELYSPVEGPSGVIGGLGGPGVGLGRAPSGPSSPGGLGDPEGLEDHSYDSSGLTPTSHTCLRLSQVLPYRNENFTIYFDNFFSHVPLFACL